MIRLYHETKRNHRQALQSEAYMVDDKGFTGLPETEQGAKHALYLVEHCGFLFPEGEGPPWLDAGPPVSESDYPFADVTCSPGDPCDVASCTFCKEPEPPNDPPTEEGDPDVPPPESDTPTVSADEVKDAIDAGELTIDPIEDSAPEVPESVEDAPVETEVSLDLSRSELRSMGASAGLEGYKTMSKVELVKAINAAKAG
jgi:hypothetical protein